MGRDREATRVRILAAAEQIIAREGVAAVRINALAAAAGVDKVLIYRYFGGRTQLLRALARERRLWPGGASTPAAFAEAGGSSLAADLTKALLAAARALRAKPLARRASIWALSERDEITREIVAARDDGARALVAALRARHPVPRFVDLEGVVALLTAAMSHLALHGGAGAGFAGIELRREEDWRRAERVLAGLVQAMLAVAEE
jgi:AcrR family transcriptional regulator